MKKFLLLLVLGATVSFAACEKNENDENWFSVPQVEVDGTTAYAVCSTNFAESVLKNTKAGFLFMPISDVSSELIDMRTPTVSGSDLQCTQSNLKPQTIYKVVAYVEVGSQRMQSDPYAFITGDSSENPDPEPGETVPTFGTLIVSDISANGATLNCQFAYENAADFTVYFRYKAASASTYTTVAQTTAEGMKTTALTGLTAETAYETALCVSVGGKTYTSKSVSFTTSTQQGGGGGVNPGLTKYAGWAELPAEVDNSDYHYAYHICPDFRVGNRLARNYAVCYSAEQHCPVWVSAPRHACYEVKGTDRTDAYGRDPMILSSIQYSSKSTGGGCNKGHMLGSAERLVTNATNRQVFYYTNIAPQYSSTFNTGGGAWNNLESFVDKQVCADTTYIVVGTYFKDFTDAYGQKCSSAKISFGGRSDVMRPSMFYYLILRTKTGSTNKAVWNCAASELRCAAFVLRHNMEKGHQPQAKDMMSVSDLEALTGFEFFTNVPNAPKSSYTASDWGL